MTFTINSKKIYEDVCFHLKIDKMINFPKLESDKLTWSFLRGYYDSDDNFCKQLSLHPICSIFSDSKNMLKSIGEFSKIPYNIKNNTIIFSNTNCIDFLGKLYSTQTNYKLLYKYNIYVSWIIPKSGSSLPEAYVLKTDVDAILPSKSKTSDVGYDLSIIKESKKLLNNVILYDTGIQICVQHGLYAEVVPRSSLSKSGYMLANSIGIIDPSYTGNIFIALIKICPDAEEIKFPFRCCQIIFRQQYHVNINNSLKSFEETARGNGGFGSTGI
jgi:dUTP pyrophosphatase